MVGKISLGILLLLIVSCMPVEPKDDGRFLIVTTTGMIGDMAKEITKDYAEVHSLMGPGVDPHLYKATQGDLRLLQQADLILYNGLHLEGKMSEVLEKLSKLPFKRVIPISDGLDSTRFIISDPKNHSIDPHVWFDVSLWSQAVPFLSQEIASIDPDHEREYQSHAEEYKNRLQKLHIWVAEEMNTIPEQQRILITAHDAFEYFGHAYDTDVLGLQGISTLSEAGIKDVTNLVDTIITRKVKAVFIESSVPQKSIEAVVEGVQKKGGTVKIGGTLYSDALGPADTPEGTYIGMVETNVRTIVKSLHP